MNTVTEKTSQEISAAARRRLLTAKGEPLFFSDWTRAVFIHYEVDGERLQRELPYELDWHEGQAHVSPVAFTMRRMRPRLGGKLAAWLFAPIGTHEFLNVRAYVRHAGEPGIYFLAEWLSNPLSVHLGPCAFGLPYRFGKLCYRHEHERGALAGTVIAGKGAATLKYSAPICSAAAFEPCRPGSRDQFLMERYAAFTWRPSRFRFFRVWHSPWLQTPIQIQVQDATLLTTTWPWFKEARLIGANYSPGLDEVWMGWPRRLDGTGRERTTTRCQAEINWPGLPVPHRQTRHASVRVWKS